jgi:hypothetical protein
MRRPFYVFVAVIVASTVLAGGVLASPNNTTTSATTSTTSGVPDPTGPTSYQGHVGNTVHIVSAEVVDGTWVVVLEADAPERVTIQDPAAAMSRLSEEGSGNFNPGAESQQVTVTTNGRTTVRIEAAEYDGGRALYVLANGDGWYTSTGMSDNPFQYFGGVSGLFTGMALAVCVSGLAAAWSVFGNDPDVRRAD